MPKQIDPGARLADGFQPTPIQAGPDGRTMPMPQAPPSRLRLIPICQVGPCTHYHELVTKLDAQEPQDGSEPTIHTTTTRTCYPSPGIEMDLSGQPVRRCNLWQPFVGDWKEGARSKFLETPRGQAEMAEFEESWPKTVARDD